jgi:hypothetical protein
MSKLKKSLKDKFDYDVTGLPAWTDNTMPNMIPDLIANSEFLGTMKHFKLKLLVLHLQMVLLSSLKQT